jgi:hypothetical protein
MAVERTGDALRLAREAVDGGEHEIAVGVAGPKARRSSSCRTRWASRTDPAAWRIVNGR